MAASAAKKEREDWAAGVEATPLVARCFLGVGATDATHKLHLASGIALGPEGGPLDRIAHQRAYDELFADTVRKVWGNAIQSS